MLISCAISLDGRIASACGDTRLSGYADKVEVHRLRSIFDAILVGINTVLSDNPHLTVSEKYYRSSRHPVRVVLDSLCRTPPDAQVITRRPNVPTIVAVTRRAPEDRIRVLSGRGVDVFVAGDDKVDIVALLRYLRSRYGVRRLMVEGGGRVIGEFLRLGLEDVMRVSITPIFFGEGGSVPMVRGVSFCDVDNAPSFDIYRVDLCDRNLILYLVRRETTVRGPAEEFSLEDFF